MDATELPPGIPTPPPDSGDIHTKKWDDRRHAFAKNDPLRVVFVTAPVAEAEGIARTLLEERLVACVNLIKGVQSMYWWEGKIEDAAETMLVMKTPASKINALIRRVRELHSNTVPEVLAVPIMEANSAYAAWVAKETGEQHS